VANTMGIARRTPTAPSPRARPIVSRPRPTEIVGEALLFAERALTAVMRPLSRHYTAHGPVDGADLPAPAPGRTYLLYAHVPFCERLCTYCSFNRFLFQEDIAVRYFADLREEMRIAEGLGYRFGSLYVGGGTPTILVDELCKTIDLARELFHIREVSAETSPNQIGPELADRLEGRVDRMSVGVQSFNDFLLRQMDRLEKYGDGLELFDIIAASAGLFHSLNVDMIFNFPSQTEAMLRHDTRLLKETGCNQTTFYPLMASPQQARALSQQIGRVDMTREKGFYDIIDEELTGPFEPSSAWTFSKEKGGMIDEYIVDYPEYLGIGSGAQSFLDGRLYTNTFSLVDYAQRVRAGRMSVTQVGRQYSQRDMMRYRFVTDLFGLRLNKQRFVADFGTPVERGLWGEVQFMRAAGGFDRDDDECFTLTRTGRYLLVVMMREMLTGSNRLRDEARAALPPAERALLLEAPEAEAVADLAV
jgi:coproporphyrinogen III oxidase-like Fe-S oxidoreductase